MRYAQFKPSYVPWVLVMVLLVMLVHSQVYWGAEVNKAEEAALTLEAAIPTLAAQRDAAVSERDRVVLRNAELAAAHQADSARWARESAREQRIRAHDEQVLLNLADSIKSRVDDETAEMVTELQDVHREVVRSLENELATEKNRYASLWRVQQSTQAMAAAAMATSDLNEKLAVTWEATSNEWRGAYYGQKKKIKIAVGGVGATALVVIGIVVVG